MVQWLSLLHFFIQQSLNSKLRTRKLRIGTLYTHWSVAIVLYGKSKKTNSIIFHLYLCQRSFIYTKYLSKRRTKKDTRHTLKCKLKQSNDLKTNALSGSGIIFQRRAILRNVHRLFFNFFCRNSLPRYILFDASYSSTTCWFFKKVISLQLSKVKKALPKTRSFPILFKELLDRKIYWKLVHWLLLVFSSV